MDVIGLLNDLTGNNLLGWKVALCSGVIALAGLQLALAARLWGVGGLRLQPDTAAVVHRWNGRAVLVGAALVGLSCVAGPAGPTSPTRVLLHSLFGSALFAVLVVKLSLLKFSRSGQRYLPVTGSALFLLFLAIWATSVADYISR
ncbi:MAG: DUF6529 family protein [Acidimicrobiia bacterium]